MTENNNKIDTSLGTDSASLYASVAGMAAPLLDDECMFLPGAGGGSHPMTLDVLQAMDQCRNFGTVQAHVETIAAGLPALSGHRDAITKVLEFLINRGLMVSAESMLASITSRASEETLPAPLTCVIFTDQRPLALKRLATSLGAYESHFGRGLRYTVIDQSRSKEMVERNASALSPLRDTGAVIDHLDREWQRRLIAHLAGNAGLTVETLHGALAGTTGTGGGLNLALLLSAGSRCILMDDQFALNGMQRPGAKTGLDIRPQAGEPLTLARDAETLRTSLLPLNEDPMALPLALCGANLGTVLTRQGLAGELAGLPYSVLQEFTHDCQVLTATLGSWGDSRYPDSQWLYRISPDALGSQLESRDTYYEFLRRPALARGFGQVQVSRVGRSAPGLIDNRNLLPPAPVGSLDDRFGFQTWLHFIYPASAAISVPVLLEYRAHLSPQVQATPLPPSPARFLGELALVRMDECAAEDPTNRFHYLSAVYQDLAAGSSEHLQEALRQFLVHTSSDRIRQIQQAMDATGQAPEYWRADAKNWLEFEVAQLSGDSAPLLAGWDPGFDGAQAAESLRETVGSSASLLRHWPGLWTACQGHFEELVGL